MERLYAEGAVTSYRGQQLFSDRLVDLCMNRKKAYGQPNGNSSLYQQIEALKVMQAYGVTFRPGGPCRRHRRTSFNIKHW